MAITQKHRLVAVASPLGEDVLVFRRMTATEHLGQLFEYQVDLLSEDDTIKLEDVLGKNMTIRVELSEGARYFNGFVSHFAFSGFLGRYASYQATLRPWLWFLTRTANCRIYQEKKVPEIIKDLFRERNFTDFQEALKGNYRQWEYCVQYRETDFNFISRLLEQEGAYYYFKHENGKHTLVLADDYSSHDTVSGYETVPYFPPGVHDYQDLQHVYEWTVTQQVQPGIYALKDFNFKTPRTQLLSSSSIPRQHALADFEVYDYPGEFEQSREGDAYAKVRIQELQAQYELLRGVTSARGIGVGHLFSLTDHPRKDQNREYLIVSASYEIESTEYESGYHGSSGMQYLCHFTAIDARQPYRSPRITPKPVVEGPQTAIVVGKAGEEIWTDQYGRVKCQFHWDRYGKADENSSCWIRVAQVWAGKQWGAMFIPRIGQEVIVDFLEGDPDQPIITGRVYNDVTKVPYELPAKKTVSTLKTNSSKGGGGFNEIRFEDEKGKEQVFIHGERNQDIRIKNDAFEWIGNERHLIVKKDQLERVEGDKHCKVVGDRNEKVNGTLSIDAGMDRQEKVGMKHALDAGMEIHLKAGMNVVIEAGTTLTLKVGGNFININPAGIFISATMIGLNSGGSAGSGSGSSPETPKQPKEADTAESGGVSDAQATPIQTSAKKLDSVQVRDMQKAQASALTSAAQSARPFCEKCEAAARARAGQS